MSDPSVIVEHMCDTVSGAIDAIVGLAARMPAAAAIAEIVAAKARLEAAQIALTQRVHDEEVFVPDHRGVTSWAVEHLRIDHRESKRFAVLARRVDRLPGFVSALEAGTITLEHLEVAATSLRRTEPEVVAELEPVLLEAAEVCTPSDLKALLAHVRNQADPESTSAGERSDFERRRLSISRTIDGSVEVSGHLDAVSGEWVMNALAGFTAPERQPDGSLDPRTPGQRRVDAWVEISRRILGQTDPDTRVGTAQMLVLVDGRGITPAGLDVDALDTETFEGAGPLDPPPFYDDGDDGADPYVPQLRLVPPLGGDDDEAAYGPDAGWVPPDSDDECEAMCDEEAADGALPLVGMTGDGVALSPAAVVQLSCDARIALAVVDDVASALLPRALRRGKVEPLRLGRTQRVVSAGLRRALVLRDAGCVYPGCAMPPSWCEAHHLIPWELGGATDLSNLALQCSFHHHQLHAHGMNVRRHVDGGWDVVPDQMMRALLRGEHRHPPPRAA